MENFYLRNLFCPSLVLLIAIEVLSNQVPKSATRGFYEYPVEMKLVRTNKDLSFLAEVIVLKNEQ